MDTPKNSSELHELRYRISQLEHLVVSNSLNCTQGGHSGDPTSITYTERNSLIERISQLEGLLAASELENANLCNEIQILIATKNRDESGLLEQINSSDQEISNLKLSIQLLEIKCTKGEKKIENMEQYINTLPSQEELEEAKEIISQLESDNLILNNEADILKRDICKYKGSLLEKEKNYQGLLVRIKELEPLEEAQQEFMDKNLNYDFADKKAISELLTVQKAQILRCRKMITSLRDKLSSGESKRAEIGMELESKSTDLILLNQHLLSSQMQAEQLLKKSKLDEQERNDLKGECAKLRYELERRDNFLKRRGEEMGNLIQLIAEMDLCVTDINKLIQLGENIAHGEEPEVDALVGIAEHFELNFGLSDTQDTGFVSAKSTSLFSSTSVHGDHEKILSIKNNWNNVNDGDQEWVLERLKRVREMRKTVEKLRNIVTDLYTEMLEGSSDSCTVQ